MGKALEWLGRDGCRSVFAELVPVDDKKSHPDRQWASCPYHSERTPSFLYKPEKDRFRCYGCGASGDLIDLFEHLNGYAEGDGFMPFRERFAPEGRLDPRREDKPSRPSGPPPWTPRDIQDVPGAWSVKAESFVSHSQSRLAANAEALAWLAGRGITAETARLCRLGWNDADKYPPVTSWGLPKTLNKRGRESKLWLPVGLVIPWARGGRFVKIKIRRPNPQDGPEELKKLKYYGVRGNAGCFSVYGRPAPGAPYVAVVVESELDAVLLWQELRRFGAVILAAPAGSKPDVAESALLSGAECVLVSLDVARPVTEGEKVEVAGPMASAWFLEQFPLAVRRPVPPSMGKDHGEAVSAGLDMLQWYEAALPHHIRRLVGLSPRSRIVSASATPAGSDEARASGPDGAFPAQAGPVESPDQSTSMGSVVRDVPVEPPSQAVAREIVSPAASRTPRPVGGRSRPGRRRHDGPEHVAVYKRGRAWIMERLDLLLSRGWTRRTLFAAGRYAYPSGLWGLAWSAAWGAHGVKGVAILDDGTIRWTVVERDRSVVWESRPMK